MKERALAATLPFWLAWLAGAAPTDVRVVRGGHPLSMERPDDVADMLVALVESSSVNSSAYARPEAGWKDALSAGSLVHARFRPSRSVRVMSAGNHERQLATVREIVLAVPRDAWPDHVWLKLDTGTVSVTKFSPCILARLVAATHPQIASTQRYKGLLETSCAEGKMP